MKKFTKIIALVLALVCICTAFAACGGNKDDGNTTKAPAVKVIDYDLTNEQYAFGVDKNQPELLVQGHFKLRLFDLDGDLGITVFFFYALYIHVGFPPDRKSVV